MCSRCFQVSQQCVGQDCPHCFTPAHLDTCTHSGQSVGALFKPCCFGWVSDCLQQYMWSSWALLLPVQLLCLILENQPAFCLWDPIACLSVSDLAYPWLSDHVWRNPTALCPPTGPYIPRIHFCSCIVHYPCLLLSIKPCSILLLCHFWVLVWNVTVQSVQSGIWKGLRGSCSSTRRQ